MNEILELANQVENALDWLRNALDTSIELCLDETGEVTPIGQPIYRDNGWEEMHETYRRLVSAHNVLATALEPIQDVIAEEKKRYDDGPDEVDPNGFKYHPQA